MTINLSLMAALAQARTADMIIDREMRLLTPADVRDVLRGSGAPTTPVPNEVEFLAVVDDRHKYRVTWWTHVEKEPEVYSVYFWVDDAYNLKASFT